MNQNLLPHLKIGPDDAEYSVIWLHGLGASGYDFKPLVPELGLIEQHKTRFILPHAPTQAVTINGGLEMPAWYDIYDLAKIDAQQDDKGIQLSSGYVNDFIENEIALGIPSTHIFLAGFSQGGVIALHTGLRYPQKLAGILGLSTYLPLHDTLSSELHDENRNIPIMMAHGLFDPVVPIGIGKLSCELIEQEGLNVEWCEYSMEHAVVPEEIVDIAKWFKEKIHYIENN